MAKNHRRLLAMNANIIRFCRRHCERSEAIQKDVIKTGSPRRFAPRDDGSHVGNIISSE